MEQRFLRALQRILNATAFENAGHLRDLEELLQRGDERHAHENLAESGCATENTGDAPEATKALFSASGKADRDT